MNYLLSIQIEFIINLFGNLWHHKNTKDFNIFMIVVRQGIKWPQVKLERTAKKFLRFQHPTAKKFSRFNIMQPQRSSWGFQDSSLSHPQSVARRTSSCGSKKKFLRMHYFLGCTVPISKLQCKNHTLFMTKMAKVAYNRYPAYDQNPYPLGLHIPIQLI